jgi:hypothetical protein
MTMKNADPAILAALTQLQQLCALRELGKAMQATRSAIAARRLAEQAQALLANRQASWQRRFSVGAGMADVGNARAAIQLARGVSADTALRLHDAQQHERCTRDAYATAEAAARTLEQVYEDAARRQRRRRDEAALNEAEDRRYARGMQ